MSDALSLGESESVVDGVVVSDDDAVSVPLGDGVPVGVRADVGVMDAALGDGVGDAEPAGGTGFTQPTMQTQTLTRTQNQSTHRWNPRFHGVYVTRVAVPVW